MLFDLHPKEKPGALFGRDEDLSKLVNHTAARRWTSILGPRMVGKTSLVKAAKYKLERRRWTVLYVNLWGSESMGGLLDGIFHALQDAPKLSRRIKKYLSQIGGLNVGPVGISVKDGAKPIALTWQVLSLLGGNADKLLIILDEVQELSDVTSHLAKILANIFSTYPNITFCFTGSQFGLLRSLHSPGPSSPMYGRNPAFLSISPFERRTSEGFIRAGFREEGKKITQEDVNEVVERFNGIPGWLALYGNSVVVSGMSHEEALRTAEREAFKTARMTLEHFLENRKRTEYLVALKAIAVRAGWSGIRSAIEANTGKDVNDGSLKNIIDALLAAYIINKRDGTYVVIDPVIQRYLLTGRPR